MNKPLLCVRNLSKSYRQGGRPLPVLAGLALDLQSGERVALLGRSGSGKSTLLNLLGGIDQADAGSIRIDDSDITRLDETERTLFRRRHIGYIYQSFNLMPTLTARENILLPMELNGTEPAGAGRRVDELLELIGLSARASAFPDQLSGGEQQRVAIARAIVHAPRLLLADEPTGNLDAENGMHILALLDQLSLERRHGLFVVTHSAAVASRADRVLTLADGRLAPAEPDLAW